MKQRTDIRHYQCANVQWCGMCKSSLISYLPGSHFNGPVSSHLQFCWHLELMCSTSIRSWHNSEILREIVWNGLMPWFAGIWLHCGCIQETVSCGFVSMWLFGLVQSLLWSSDRRKCLYGNIAVSDVRELNWSQPNLVAYLSNWIKSLSIISSASDKSQIKAFMLVSFDDYRTMQFVPLTI